MFVSNRTFGKLESINL